MKNIMKRGFAVLMALVLVISLVPSAVFTASAATYTYNWGSRGTLATELSDMAEAWYSKYDITYAELSALSGASSTSSVPSSALYSKLKTLMTTAHTTKTSYDGTKSLFMYTDCQNGGGKISSFYSGTSIGPSWDSGEWNREHTWPNSKGLGGSDENDIMMLRPTSIAENSSRGNTAYGEGSSYYDPNDESDGKYNLHGDVARIVLYVYVRWGNTSYMWGTSGVMESKAVLLKWMEEDPVDTWELGRNDAVQSITGTRNVFVDYPELAFDLFETDVPAGYESPSSSGAVITAQSNNTSYGTVSVSGKTITAYPYEGYQVSGYKVLSGTATVVQNGNVFTVSASSDCTVQIQFAPRVLATLSFTDQGVLQSSQTAYIGDTVTLPDYAGTEPDSYVFRGWVTQQIAETETKPEIHSAGSSYTVEATTAFYALYAKIDEASTSDPIYMLVTDVSQLSEGASIVIASATAAVAMKSTGGDNNRYAGTVTKNDNNTVSFAEDVSIDILTLGSGSVSGTYSFFSEANGQYLAAGTTTGSNILKLQNSVDAAASFAVTVNTDGTAEIISQTSSDRNVLRYNSGANIFACYASGQKAVSLYASSGGTAYYTTDPVNCEHSNTSEVAAVAATCTQSGFTAGVQCDDCGRIISGHEVVAALGHSWSDWTQTTAPKCETAGEQSRICSACEETETQPVAATGHSYEGVVTDPTATEQGYTTYTCSVCSDSYVGDYTEALGETYTVSFVVPSNVASIADMSCGKSGITLPEAGIPSGDYAYSFAGWLATTLDNSEEKPDFLQAGETYYATGNTALHALYTYCVGGTGKTEYTLTDIAAIEPTDVVVITMTYTGDGTVYAMNNDNGTGNPPDGVVISAADGKLTSEPADNLKWNIGGSAGAYIFYPNGSTTTWLYCTDTNKGVRVGTITANKFSIDASSGYLKHTGTSRYVGVYRNNPDWRCYTNTSTNIGDQTLGFYVKGEAGTTYYTTVIINSCTHDSYTDGFCTNCGEPEPALVAGMDMLLRDDLEVNFYLNTQLDVTVSVGGTQKLYTADELTETADGKFIATVSVAAAQMTDEITVQADGYNAQTYTVRQYADKILADEAYSDYHAIVKEMLNYGGCAQQYFDYNPETLANSNITGVGAAEVPQSTQELSYTGAAEGITFYAASLSYRDKVALRFYFQVESSIEGYTFSANGVTYSPVQKDTYYVVEVPNITPENLDQQVELTVTDTLGNVLTVSYGPMNYIVRMKQKGSDSLKALLKALYNYHLAAKQLRTTV